jgi:hypothetical protein
MSTYTSNTGIEKIATGAQSGTWGTTTNTNFDIIDRAINGVGAVTLSGSTHTLTTSDGSTSDGQYKLIVFGGSLSGANTITISPNDADKIFFVYNNTSGSQNIIFTQGSGANVTVPNGTTKIIYADGGGSGAIVADLTDKFAMGSVDIDGGAIDGTVIGANSAAAATVTTLTGSGDVTIDTNTLKVDTSNNRVGILQASPTVPLEVGGVVFSSTGGFKFPDATTQTTASDPYSGPYAVTTGSSNVYAVAPSPALGAYAAGNRVFFEPNHTNTGSATLNVSARGAKTIKTVYGETLAGGELISGGIYSVIYDGTDFLLVNSEKKLRGCVVVQDVVATTHDTWTNLDFASGDVRYDTSDIADYTNNYFTIPADANAVLMTCGTMYAESGVDSLGAAVTGFNGTAGTGGTGNFVIGAANNNTQNSYRGIRMVTAAAVFEMPLLYTASGFDTPRRLYAQRYVDITAGSGTVNLSTTATVTILE